MIRFLAKGLVRDRSRSIFPLLAIIITVTLVIFGIGFMEGATNTSVSYTHLRAHETDSYLVSRHQL